MIEIKRIFVFFIGAFRKYKKIKLDPYDYSWSVLDNNLLSIRPILEVINNLMNNESGFSCFCHEI